MSSDIYPDFLSTEFFTAALANGLNVQVSTVHILSVSLSAGSKSGENFCSDVYRAVVQFRLQDTADDTVSLIVKAMPYTQARGPLLEDLLLFEKEISMYTDTLPRMSKLLGGLKLSAKYYYSVSTPYQIIVLEDLQASGYTLADRMVGLDETHCNLVLETLARFHAASMVLADQDARAMDSYSFGLLPANAPDNMVIKMVFEDGLKSVIQLASSWPGYAAIVERMKAIQNNFVRLMVQHCSESPSFYRVLNHGDCWINNIMFKYDAHGTPVQLVFIDYQVCFYSSPGCDLNYFINTSPKHELRENRREHLIGTYHMALVQALSEMRCPVAISRELSVDRIKDEIQSREFFGFYAAVGILPIVLNVPDDKDTSFETRTGVDSAQAIQDAMYNNPAYVRALKFILRRCDELHVLDNVAEIYVVDK